jgi:[1-hydroxy-2-(trimethylamino)ethyl]phosphonate dioxygenase
MLSASQDSEKPTNRGAIIATIVRLFRERGDAAYIGEPVSQTEHALQTAWLAEKAGAESPLIAAALLHDVGHLVHDLEEDCAEHGIDSCHENVGARWLQRFFVPETTEPCRLHVAAKRCLCAIEPSYRALLSEASLQSLKVQGGAFTSQDAEHFLQQPHAQAALALRRWDEEAKVKGLETPELEHFRCHLEKALRAVGT